jgi:hypothetical protein
MRGKKNKQDRKEMKSIRDESMGYNSEREKNKTSIEQSKLPPKRKRKTSQYFIIEKMEVRNPLLFFPDFFTWCGGQGW